MNTLITYTRNPRNNQLNGCVVAVGDCDTGFRVGWSHAVRFFKKYRTLTLLSAPSVESSFPQFRHALNN